MATERIESGTLRGTEWKDIDYRVEGLRQDLYARRVETEEQLQSRVSDLVQLYGCGEHQVREILREQLTTHYWKWDIDRIKTPAMVKARRP